MLKVDVCLEGEPQAKDNLFFIIIFVTLNRFFHRVGAVFRPIYLPWTSWVPVG